ncbi:hypothetical protein AX774_g1370 [Zancudomyces culisetae]|uniref:Uncharacterized protein n=1 Tax=Zancudomyces culisetae TaxID=1213189 RepID=A0A1R1PQC9_ZANCU|nr:hypothetical protein AX774_g7312 [Zancudomyces culisetae]OMH83167.1 hypothetical protein AX774_g3328 [Zancudomyces culisetae]OMH85103.1 hypothetical protein AX774_g1370 [Zancudomyces culisetae]|eukprot:OMH79279.1 hypothetical protein AX774_g7312 [Zancudomyces culisetae]
MPIIWPVNNERGWTPLLLLVGGTISICILIDDEYRNKVVNKIWQLSEAMLSGFCESETASDSAKSQNKKNKKKQKSTTKKQKADKDNGSSGSTPTKVRIEFIAGEYEYEGQDKLLKESLIQESLQEPTRGRAKKEKVLIERDAEYQMEREDITGNQKRHVMYVCTKCQRNDNMRCIPGYYSCFWKSEEENIGDMEDMFASITSATTTDGKQKKTGRILYENLKNLAAQRERIKQLSVCDENIIEHDEYGRIKQIPCSNTIEPRLEILPVRCLGTCEWGNVIAFAAEGKFAYQFGDINEGDAEDLNAVLEFTDFYLNSEDGFSKTKTRPARMKSNVLSRIPPFSEKFTNLEDF